jgi:hypothetical protein
MKAVARNAVIIFLALIVIIALTYFFKGPVLYSLQKDQFSSQFHDNPDVLKIQSINSTTDVLPLMQELMDYSGPMVVNINLKNTEQARHDLELFSRSQVKLNNLIVNLDMDESEMNDFSRSKARQKELLSNLMNSSISFSELESLEIQYREKDNPDIRTSVKIQKDVIRKKVQALYEEYHTETETTTRIGLKQGLDGTGEQQSVEEVLGYIQKINETGGSYVNEDDFPVRNSSQISFIIYPDSASYGDSIRCFGNFFPSSALPAQEASDIPVTIYIDNLPVIDTRTDSLGSFTATLPIGRITPGNHALYAQSGTTLSVISTLNISSVDSKTTLSAGKVNPQGNVTLTGTVTANRPVSFVPVQIISDDTPVVEIITNARGEFNVLLTLPEGKHTVTARFSGDGFPINPSESEAVVVDVSFLQVILPGGLRLFLLAGFDLLFLLFAVGAAYYLRRPLGLKRYLDAFFPSAQKQGTLQSERDMPAASDVLEYILKSGEPGSNIPHEENPVSRYLRLIQSVEPGEAAYKVYQEFSRRIARDLKIKRHIALTPREIARACTLKPYFGAVLTFVGVYEKIRYGGDISSTIKDEFEISVQKTDASLGGEDY